MPEPVPGTLAEALAQLQGRLPRVAKEHTAKVTSQKTGSTHTYAYADLTDVSEKLLPVMTALGLSFTCSPTMVDDAFLLHYRLIHSVDDDEIEGFYPLPDPRQLGPQDLGKAITYARRYALCAVTGLAPGGDDDDAGTAQQEHQRQPRNVPDAQLAATGQMTRAQKAEHERLAADTVRDPKRAERSHPRGPDPDDPWAQDAPVDGQRAAALRESIDRAREDAEGGRLPAGLLTDPEDKPGSSTLEQQQQIAIRLAAKGITTREDKLAFCGITTGRDVESSRELAFNEALAILRAADELEAVGA
jgi:hypothetical protein